VHEQWSGLTAAKDLDGLMEHTAPDIVSYEHAAPLQHIGIDDVREVCRRGLESSPGRIDFDIPDLTVHADGDLAVARGLDRIFADGAESRSRATRVFERRNGQWQMVHQHRVDPGDQVIQAGCSAGRQTAHTSVLGPLPGAPEGR
jgi:ketosteroid isomerase-like protein